MPFEQRPNPFITPELSFEFHYFFMRKFWFAYLAKALVIFPGGFGTMDELFEILTLAQTRKLESKIVIVLYGTKFWREVLNFEALVEHGTIERGGSETVSVRRRSGNRAGHLAGAIDAVFPGAGEASAGTGSGNSGDRQIARVKLSIKSLWKQSGKVDKAFAVLLVLYLILLGRWPDSGFEGSLRSSPSCLGAWIALRLLRIGLRKLTWRLRNRLMVAYCSSPCCRFCWC